MSRDLSYETTRSFVRGVFSNPLTSRNTALLEEYPQVKRGSSHRCSEWSVLRRAAQAALHRLSDAT